MRAEIQMGMAAFLCILLLSLGNTLATCSFDVPTTQTLSWLQLHPERPAEPSPEPEPQPTEPLQELVCSHVQVQEAPREDLSPHIQALGMALRVQSEQMLNFRRESMALRTQVQALRKEVQVLRARTGLVQQKTAPLRYVPAERKLYIEGVNLHLR